MGWKNKPTSFAAQIQADGDQHLRKISAEMLRGVITGSPVMDGTFRSNHRVTVDTITNETVEGTGNTSPKGNLDQVVFNDGAKEILKAHLGSCVYIQNNLPYAVALENGHSEQAKNGVYALTFQYICEKYR
ncbi:hypothetical protein EXE25_18010 [Acinetobacter bouvetii]|uniref:HK97 gp10 family phage protein n=1 Tax=Acinetobacter bouvetii TaxID=202951 RepID=A0A4Q7APM8_9GAMM|nr:hypothetical protein [Acinetobacter bouvetii]RZG63958.1 hypothetical protein EXE25_18010 [Acinetobacter bouvetii]